MSRTKKLALGTVANGFGQAVTAITAIVSVPLFLSTWGPDTYGRWLLISAIPAYIAIADFGVATAASNAITGRRLTARRDELVEIFQSSVALTSAGAIAALLLTAVTLASGWISLDSDGYLAAFLLAVWGCCNLYNSAIDALFRADGDYLTGPFALNGLRLLEWGGSMAALAISPRFSSVAAGLLVVRVIGGLVLVAIARRSAGPDWWGIRNVRRSRIREIWKPAVAFAFYPLSNAVLIQGVTLVIGAVLGPAAVAIYNTYRTLTRLVTQALTLVNRTFWPHFSELQGTGSHAAVQRLLRQASLINLSIGVLAAGGCLLLGEWFLAVWAKGKIPFDFALLVCLTAGVLVTSAWQSRWVFLMAINSHSRFSLMYLCSAPLVVAGTWIAVQFFGLLGAAGVLLLHELGLALILCRMVNIRTERP